MRSPWSRRCVTFRFGSRATAFRILRWRVRNDLLHLTIVPCQRSGARAAALAGLLTLLAGPAPMAAQTCWNGVAPLELPHPDEFPAALTAVIEIPAGTAVKYEIDERTGVPVADRFLSTPVAYPVNYGFVAGSLQEDGDPLDVVVYTRVPLLTGSAVTARPIGLLEMTDRGEKDDKVVAVPVDAVDPSWSAVQRVEDLPEIERRRLEEFFRVYKELPGPNPVVTGGYGGPAEAAQAIEEAVSRCRGSVPLPSGPT